MLPRRRTARLRTLGEPLFALTAAEADVEKRAANGDALDLIDFSLGKRPLSRETESNMDNLHETASTEMTVIIIADNHGGFLCLKVCGKENGTREV